MAQPSTTKPRVMKSAQESVDRFKTAWDYAKKNHHNRWERNEKLYNNKRAMVGYEGITNTFVPMSFSTVETITAALCTGRPSIDFMPQDMYKYIQAYAKNGVKPDLKALNAQFDYYWECDNWDLKSIKTVRMALKLGTSCEWVYWDGDKPRIINLNPRDAIIDPSLTDPMQLITHPKDFYSGRRYLTTIDALKAEMILDPATGKMKPRFKNTDKLVAGTGSSGDETDKERKEQLLGSTADSEDLVEVLELVDGDTITTIGQRRVTLESRPNKLGIHNLVIHRFIADESTIYGKAILDPIAAPQELLNDITNQRTDAVTDALNPQSELDPKYASWLPRMKNLPSTVYPFIPGSFKYLQKPIVPQNAFMETNLIKNDIREATASDQVVKGVAADQRTTATEVNAQLAQSGERFELYVRMLEREGFYQRAKIVYKLMLHYVKDKQLVPTQSMDGPKFRKFDTSHYDESYEPSIRLEATVKGAKTQDAQQATQAYQILIQDPTNDLWEAKKVLYPKMFDLSEEELDRIIGQQKPQQPQGPPMPGAADAAPGQPGQGANPLAAMMSAPGGPAETGLPQ